MVRLNLVPYAFEWKKLKSAFICCYCALWYVNAFKFNLYEIFEVKVFDDLGERSHLSCLSTFSKGIFSETTGPISFKFHVQPPGQGGGGEKFSIFGTDHITKTTAIPMYGKNL